MVRSHCGTEVALSDGYGTHCRGKLRPLLKGLDYSSHIDKLTQDFTGRTWVFQAINDWLEKPDAPHFFLLTGEPGCGKSAIAARLVQFSLGRVPPPDGLSLYTTKFLTASHFCYARDSLWIDPRTFARSLSLQLADFSDLARALMDVGDREINPRVHQEAVYVHGEMTGKMPEPGWPIR